jgi:hypothetical protein
MNVIVRSFKLEKQEPRTVQVTLLSAELPSTPPKVRHEMTKKDVITQPELALETVPDLPALRVFRTPFAPVNCSLRRRRWWRESPC